MSGRARVIDETISTLKVVGQSDLYFGIFLILEGLSLIYLPGVFPIFVVLSILIAYAFAFEWFFSVIRAEKSFWNVAQRFIIIILLITLAIYCFHMIFNEDFRSNVDRVLVAATTIADSIKNLVHIRKIEEKEVPRKIFTVFSALCMLYGAAYGILGVREANLFTTTMHGMVFILLGLCDIWYFIRIYQQTRSSS